MKRSPLHLNAHQPKSTARHYAPEQGSHDRPPLHLCEVLEKEFITVHGRPLSYTPTWLLQSDQIKNATALVGQLRQAEPGSICDDLNERLEQIEPGLSAKVARYTSDSPDALEQLVTILNRLLEVSGYLYDVQKLPLALSAKKRSCRNGPSMLQRESTYRSIGCCSRPPSRTRSSPFTTTGCLKCGKTSMPYARLTCLCCALPCVSLAAVSAAAPLRLASSRVSCATTCSQNSTIYPQFLGVAI